MTVQQEPATGQQPSATSDDTAPSGDAAAGEASKPKLAPMPPGIRSTKLARWVDRVQYVSVWPMFILSSLFVVLSTYLLFPPENMTAKDKRDTVLALGVLLVVFLLDYFFRWLFARDRAAFIRGNWAELLSAFIPPLRPMVVLFYVWRLPMKAGSVERDARLRYQITIAFAAVFVTYAVSIWVWRVEHGRPGATILDWGDSIWWAIATVTTVGYGDVVPVTVPGRVLGSLLMVVGTLLIGVVAASLVQVLREKGVALSAHQAQKLADERRRAEELAAHDAAAAKADARPAAKAAAKPSPEPATQPTKAPH